MAGRKLAFEREVVLDKAMDLFWEKGYHATGLTELLERMGIKRQSLYNTFGSKHQLFLEAIAHYGSTVVQTLETELLKPGSVIANIETFFDQKIATANTDCCRGCFLVNAMVELSPHDQKVAAEVERLCQQGERAFEAALNKAIAEGELPTDFETKKIARYLHQTALGLSARTKGIPNPDDLHETIELALAVLHP
ncbi:regulatory protein TetR [[Leptolyngbya] sp. PCC 7376]|uniref:TetR/AcrR family transcriptional regulator n=1 Tax=[Leptolyngbya] sp. PCC 7376 TaxID=111781 RepID=UPI00029F3E8E|nr:TetR/AcrR family transcriptional regulator [[Leptolyngbya] sp. PCC 7376]AFY40103.1 regulatory protein TetR [[Leptolyngbya] sp. PCC 7376]